MKKILILLTVIVLPTISFCQEYTLDDYDWEKERSLYELNEKEKNDPAIVLFYGIYNETDYNNAEKTTLSSLEVVHKIVVVNSSDELNKYNKVYIPVRNKSEIVGIKARTISKSGIVTELTASNIKEIKNEDDTNYKIFAIEGAEAGGEIEYLYKIKKEFQRNGYFTLQHTVPILRSEFSMITPANLIMEIKCYNAVPEISDTTIEGKRFLKLENTNVKGIKEEEFASTTANKLRMEYKLAYNTARGNSRLFTWTDASQNIYSNVYGLNPKELKAITGNYKKLKISPQEQEEEKINKITQHVKKNFYETAESNIWEVNVILEKKIASSLGMMRLYAGLFRAAGIESEVVYTTDRNKRRFDPDFDSWSYLSESMFYFPASGKYFSPSATLYPFGFAPFNLTNNHGLFVKLVKLGDMETGLGEVRFIEALPAVKSKDDLFIDVEFTEQLEKNKLRITRESSGYNAINSYSVIPFLEQEKKELLIKNVVDYLIKDGQFEMLELRNNITYPMADAPVVIEAVAVTSEFIEKAGNKILFRIGDVIGAQAELYADKEREQEIENYYNRQYNRSINFTIPDGYQVKNLDDLIIEESCEEDGRELFVFKSGYEQNGKKISVKIFETYETINYPAGKYENFRKVINAAADFNKITLVLEPEK